METKKIQLSKNDTKILRILLENILEKKFDITTSQERDSINEMISQMKNY
jgi:hypothetical protein